MTTHRPFEIGLVTFGEITPDPATGQPLDPAVRAGRGAYTESFPLFGHDLADYDELFEESSTCSCASIAATTSPGPDDTGPR